MKRAQAPSKAKKGPRVLIGVTGSIAAYKACDIISGLRKRGCDVKAVMTPEAKRFITPLTLQTVTQNPVLTDMWDEPREWDPVHTSLAEWADLILVAPATAHIIGKLANGMADCLLSAVILASKAKVIIAPAMNDKMYLHRAVQDNIGRLKGFGYSFIGPVKGRLACGYTAIGHLASIEDIVKAAAKAPK